MSNSIVASWSNIDNLVEDRSSEPLKTVILRVGHLHTLSDRDLVTDLPTHISQEVRTLSGS
jgi:hypothetical protein